MSLRTRLFLLVSGLFLAFAIIGSVMESFVMKKAIAESQENVRNRILTLSEENRKDLENFVAWLIAETDTNINAILNNTAVLKLENLRFGPTLINKKKGTWENASELLLNFNWIDFLQNTNPKQVTTIIPDTAAMTATYRVGIDENLAWVFFKERPEPYLAIRVPYAVETETDDSHSPDEDIFGVDPIPYLLFDPQKMGKALSASLPQQHVAPISLPWAEGYSMHVNEVLQAFNRAMANLRDQSLKLPAIPFSQVQTIINTALKMQGGNLFTIPAKALMSTASMGKFIENQLEDIIVRYTEVNLIWIMLTFFDSGIFGDDLFAFPAPEGIGLFFLHDDVGVGIHSKDVLYPEPFFDDRSYFDTHATTRDKSALASSLAIITPPNSDRVYFANTARFIVKQQLNTAPGKAVDGFLTIGVDSEKILENVVLAVRETALLVHDGKLATAFGPQGKLDPSQMDFSITDMLEKKSGVINWNKEAYFFLHLQPFPEIDLHFFLLAPEKREFALLRDLKVESQKIVESVLNNLHINGIILLIIAVLLTLQVSSRITKPIGALAMATRKVTEGKLDEVVIPPATHEDEIAVLCKSFEEMVNGLKEKEKVKGVLNKVVSQEIAKEILKGTLHLGGEEKVITLFFGDIRGFTNLTQKMAPHDVVDLLNTCMTRIATVIDRHNGVIDKFIGDEVMAIFGAPLSMPNAALQAISCGIEVVDSLKEWNRLRSEQNLPIVEMGFGIHTGEALVGNMGAENRLNYTATGSNVNLASRICSAAKGMEILITKATLEEPGVKEHIDYEELPPASLKGFTEPITVYRVTRLKSDPERSKGDNP